MNVIIRQHPALVVTAGYFYVSTIGFLVSRKYLGTYKVNILDYAGPQDFLLEALRNPWLFLASTAVFIGIIGLPLLFPRILSAGTHQSIVIFIAGFIYAFGISVVVPADYLREMIEDRQSLQCIYLTSSQWPGYVLEGHGRQVIGLSEVMIFERATQGANTMQVLIVPNGHFHHGVVESNPNNCMESDA